MQRFIPCCDLCEVSITIDGRQPWVGWPRQVTTVNHIQSVIFKHVDQASDAQSLWPHRCAPSTRSDVCGHANQFNGCTHERHPFFVDDGKYELFSRIKKLNLLYIGLQPEPLT